MSRTLTIHAPEEFETERLVMKRSRDARDKDQLCDHVRKAGRRDFTRWSSVILPATDEEEVMDREFEWFSLEHDDEFFTKVAYTIFLKDTGDMAGYVSLDLMGVGKPGFDAYVFEEYRSRGIGDEASWSFLVKYFMGDLVDDPLDTVTTWSGNLNYPAHKLLTSLGFSGPELEGEGPMDGDDDDPVGAMCKYELYSFWFEMLYDPELTVWD